MAALFGAFGKMPALGDFFRISPPQGFVDPWDRWLQEGMIAARETLGPRWQDCYMSAPIWRFTLAGGLAGAAPVLGVLMPSIDRVGRQFPLTLMAALEAGQDPVIAHLRGEPSFAALEAVALDALEDAMTREVLTERLSAIDPPGAGAVAAMRRVGGMLALTGGAVASPFAELGGALVAGDYRAAAVFSAGLGDDALLLVAEGLPEAGRMAALFDLDADLWQKEEAP